METPFPPIKPSPRGRRLPLPTAGGGPLLPPSVAAGRRPAAAADRLRLHETRFIHFPTPWAHGMRRESARAADADALSRRGSRTGRRIGLNDSQAAPRRRSAAAAAVVAQGPLLQPAGQPEGRARQCRPAGSCCPTKCGGSQAAAAAPPRRPWPRQRRRSSRRGRPRRQRQGLRPRRSVPACGILLPVRPRHRP